MLIAVGTGTWGIAAVIPKYLSLRLPSVICLIQASKSSLVTLLALLYDFLYVHQKHTVSISIDTTFPKRLHRNHNIFTFSSFLLEFVQNWLQSYIFYSVKRNIILPFHFYCYSRAREKGKAMA